MHKHLKMTVMKSKVLILDNKIYSLSGISNFLKQKKYEIVKPSETESAFNICSSADLKAVIVDLRLFGAKSNVFLQNLKDNVLPEDVKLITISDSISPRKVFDDLRMC